MKKFELNCVKCNNSTCNPFFLPALPSLPHFFPHCSVVSFSSFPFLFTANPSPLPLIFFSLLHPSPSSPPLIVHPHSSLCLPSLPQLMPPISLSYPSFCLILPHIIPSSSSPLSTSIHIPIPCRAASNEESEPN